MSVMHSTQQRVRSTQQLPYHKVDQLNEGSGTVLREYLKRVTVTEQKELI